MTVEPTKVCAECKERKPWSQFWAKVKWDDGTMRNPQAYCKDCQRERRRGPERQEYERRYYRRLMRNAETRARRREIVRRSKRKRLNIPPERWRVQPTDGEASVYLPVGPFREWLATKVEDHSLVVVSELTGANARSIHRWLTESERVDLDSADRAFCALGEPEQLRELYPEVYA